eukprot:RCo030658
MFPTSTGGPVMPPVPAAEGTPNLQGSLISLISKSEIRYEGTLYTINPEENTIALHNVRVMGTEGRVRGNQIPAGDGQYEFIIFRGSDIKDLTVYDQPASRAQPLLSPQPLTDPAVLTAW